MEELLLLVRIFLNFGGNVEGVSLNEVFNKLEYCTKPVVAAINGIASEVAWKLRYAVTIE